MIDLNLFKSSAIGVVVLGLVACGGGGGGGGPAPISYDGVTEQAKITVDNSEELTEASIDGASPADSGIANVSSNGDKQEKAQLLGVAKNLGKILKGVDLSQDTGGQPGTAQVISDSDSATSACGGSASYSATVDDVTGNFSANFTFSNYVDCDDKSEINGSFSAIGTINITTKELDSMTITFSNLTYKEGDESMGMDGSMDFVVHSSSRMTVTANMDFIDNAKNKTFRVQNYVVNITEFISYIEMTVAGNVYHPDHGYVTVSTLSPIGIYNNDDNPSYGEVQLVGAGGTKVVIIFTGSNNYLEAIDTDGDGTADTTNNCTWSTNTCSAPAPETGSGGGGSAS